MRVLSLGAGVQSTALLIMSATGQLPRVDAAIFSDTGWEPAAVHQHLDRIERDIAVPAGIPIYRVSTGNIRDDALDPRHRFASMPLFVKNTAGTVVMLRRQCTNEYKIAPIRREIRRLLGAPPRLNGVPGRVPRGRYAEMWVGISTDERDRAEGRRDDVAYQQTTYPLLDADLDWVKCQALNDHYGYRAPKSACIGCPFHTNRQWRALREDDPVSWADAVAFDHALRAGNARTTSTSLRGGAYLHRSCVPLVDADIDRVTGAEARSRQGDLVADLDLQAFEEGLPDVLAAQLGGCSPWACRSEVAA